MERESMQENRYLQQLCDLHQVEHLEPDEREAIIISLQHLEEYSHRDRECRIVHDEHHTHE